MKNKIDKPTRLLNRNFILLWQGQLITLLGNSILNIASMFWIKHQTGSASLMGLLMMAYMIPGAILGLISGVFADRYSRWKIIVFSDLIRGVLTLGFAIYVLIMPEAIDTTIFMLFVISIISGIIISFFNPAVSASIPQLVPADKLGHSNSIVLSTNQISNMVGQGIGGILFRILGAPYIFLINGIGFIYAGISEMFIRIPQEFPEKNNEKGKIANIFHDIKEGLRFILDNRGMTYALIGSSIVMFLFGPLIVLLPFFVEDYLKAATDWYGYLVAGLSVGSAIGYATGSIKVKGHVRSSILILFLIIAFVLWGILGFMTDKIIALMMMILFGFFNGFIIVNVITILQQSTPDNIRGRVFSVFTTINTGLMPLGMGLAGIIADLLDKNIPIMFLASAIISLIIIVICAFSRQYRKFLAYEAPKENKVSVNK